MRTESDIQTSEKKPFKLHHYLVGENPTKEDIRTIILAAVLAPIVLLLSTKILVNIGEKSWTQILYNLLFLLFSIEMTVATVAFSTKSTQEFYDKKSDHLIWVLVVDSIPIAIILSEIYSIIHIIFTLLAIISIFVILLEAKKNNTRHIISITLIISLFSIACASQMIYLGHYWFISLFIFKAFFIFPSSFRTNLSDTGKKTSPPQKKESVTSFEYLTILMIVYIIFVITLYYLGSHNIGVYFVGWNFFFLTFVFLVLDLIILSPLYSLSFFQNIIRRNTLTILLFYLFHILHLALIYYFYGSYNPVIIGTVMTAAFSLAMYFHCKSYETPMFVLLMSLCMIGLQNFSYLPGLSWFLNLYIIKLIFCFGSGFRLRNK